MSLVPRLTRVNSIANVAVVIAASVLLISLLSRIFSRGEFVDASVSPDGKSVRISGVDFGQSEKTVLLVLDRSCKFCLQEVPFYRELAVAADGAEVRVIAVFEHDIEEGKRFLGLEQIPISEVIRIRMRSTGAAGTPTVLLVDKEGAILAKWTGSLSAPFHSYIRELMSRSNEEIRNDRSPYLKFAEPAAPPTVDLEVVRRGLLNGDMTLVDLDSRTKYAARHLAGAQNIPEEEIYARSKNELPKTMRIALFSRERSSFKIRNAITNLQSLGYSEVAWLNSTLDEARLAGFELRGPQR